MSNFRQSYYTAIGFSKRPDLHITFEFIKKISPEEVAGNLMGLATYVRAYKPDQFQITWNKVTFFGRNKDIRVLVPGPSQPLPKWVQDFAPNKTDFGGWEPHISCEDAELDLIADQIFLGLGKTKVAIWELELNDQLI